MLRNFFELLRLKQYIKNGLIFVPLIFSRHSLEGVILNLPRTFLIFIAFCLISSTVYIINDLLDESHDKFHPVKSKRPIASGKVSIKFALVTSIFLFFVSLLISFSLGILVTLILLAYLINNIVYSLILKKYALFDLFSISFGFLLRVYAGAAAISVPVSSYLFLVIFFLSLYLGAGKRRYEILLLDEQFENHRQSLKGYSVYYLDQLMLISSTITLMIYSLYVLDAEKKILVFTIPIVTLGLFRYYGLTHNMQKGEPSDDIIGDKLIVGTLAVYFIVISLGFLQG